MMRPCARYVRRRVFCNRPLVQAFSYRKGVLTGACWTTMFLMKRSSSSRFFASAFDSAFFRRRRTNLTDFSGQRPTDSCSTFSIPPTTNQGRRTLGRLELLRLASTANATSESAEGDDLLVVLDVAEVGVRLRELEAYTPKIRPSVHFPPRKTNSTDRSERPQPRACS